MNSAFPGILFTALPAPSVYNERNIPHAMANSQTRATKKYQETKGIGRKTFVVNKKVAEEFALACHKAGISQASAIDQFMKAFVKEHS